MAPKHVNSKVAAAAEKKAIVENQKKAQLEAQKELLEQKSWSEGAKDHSKKQQEEEKRVGFI